MYAWLSTQIGADAANVVSYVALLIAVLLIAWLCIAVIRRVGKGTFVIGGKNRAARLSVRDAAAVDNRRRLVLVRRDDVEHLILIGGPSDLVIERNIAPPQIADASVPVLSLTANGEIDRVENVKIDAPNSVSAANNIPAVNNVAATNNVPSANEAGGQPVFTAQPDLRIQPEMSHAPVAQPKKQNTAPRIESAPASVSAPSSERSIQQPVADSAPVAPIQAPCPPAAKMQTQQHAANTAQPISPANPQVTPFSNRVSPPSQQQTANPPLSPYLADKRPGTGQQPATGQMPPQAPAASGQQSSVQPAIPPQMGQQQPVAVRPQTTIVPPRSPFSVSANSGNAAPDGRKIQQKTPPLVAQPARTPAPANPQPVPANPQSSMPRDFSKGFQEYPVQHVLNSVPPVPSTQHVANGDLSSVAPGRTPPPRAANAPKEAPRSAIKPDVKREPAMSKSDDFDQMLREELMHPPANLKVVSSNNK